MKNITIVSNRPKPQNHLVDCSKQKYTKPFTNQQTKNVENYRASQTNMPAETTKQKKF